MSQRVLISGYGSIGRRHAKILSRLVKKKNITILTNQKLSNFRTIKNLQSLDKINPSYIVISNPTSDHINKIKYIEQNFKNKLVLVEKPLFSKLNKIIINFLVLSNNFESKSKPKKIVCNAKNIQENIPK